MRGGLLLAGNPHLGLIKYQNRYYSLTSLQAMREFVADPEKYLEGVIRQAHRSPALIHLLSLQDSIPYSDLSELVAASSIDVLSWTQQQQQQRRTTVAGAMVTKIDAWTQTNPDDVAYEPPDPNYDWNEWNLRRKAIQLANLMSKRTHSTQTNLSHFRRDNETQYTLPLPLKDGSMPGKGTQTGITKGTNVARTTRYIGGLRGAPGTTMAVRTLTLPEFVTHESNPPLNEQHKNLLKPTATPHDTKNDDPNKPAKHATL